MTSPAIATSARTDRTDHHVHARARRGEETKPAWKTTELFVYLAAVAGVLIASNVVGDSGGSAGDVFTADKAWWFITLLTIGYMISRGLAKSGSRSRDVDPRTQTRH